MAALLILAFVVVCYYMFRGLFDGTDTQGTDKDYWS